MSTFFFIDLKVAYTIHAFFDHFFFFTKEIFYRIFMLYLHKD